MSTYAPVLDAVLSREPEPDGGVRSGDVDYTVDGTACRGYLAVPADVRARCPACWSCTTGSASPTPCGCAATCWPASATRRSRPTSSAPTPGPPRPRRPRVAGAYYGDPELWRQRVVGAFDRMREESVVDGSRTAAIGYCFGGSTALLLARTGADLRAVVSFHGGLQAGPEGEAERIRASLLILTGAADPVVPDEAVLAVQNEFRRVPDLDWQVVTYAGAMHAFAVPGVDAPDHGAQFQATAERRSWTAMKDFFAEVL